MELRRIFLVWAMISIVLFDDRFVGANMAFKRDVTQSSTDEDHAAQFAVDGDETTWSSTTPGRSREWWQIDFGGVVPVSVIEILPKPGASLSNFWIIGSTRYSDRDDITHLLSQASFALFDPMEASSDLFGEEVLLGELGANQNYPGFPSRRGTPWLRYFTSFSARYIRILQNGTTPLQIAEVKVYPTTCGTSYRRVGQVTRLSNRFHGVGGTAAIVDDCTIIISKFTFDADLSLETRIVLGPEGQFNTGVSVSTNLVKSGAYKGELLVLKDLRFTELIAARAAKRTEKSGGGGGGEAEEPQSGTSEGGVSDQSDPFQCISVFCTQAWIDFGSGCFQFPQPNWTWD